MANFLFRCDASPVIGVGHFMRSSVLAGALRERHHHVQFAMREMTALVEDRLGQLGFSCHRLDTVGDAASPMIGELPALTALIEQERIACIVVDHYGAESAYFSSLRQTGAFVATLDDLSGRDLRGVAWLLNQNLGADRFTYQVEPKGIRLLGSEFCLLRPQFAEARGRLRRRFTAADNNILLTLGGGEAWPTYERILRSLNDVTRFLHLRVILPTAGEHDLTARLANLSRHNLEILHNVANMAEPMAWADLSINAGGSTCWELCCLGVPMMVQALSADQEMVAGTLEHAGVARRLPETQQGLAQRVQGLLDAPEEREAMSRRAMTLVDGLGAERAAQSLEAAVI